MKDPLTLEAFMEWVDKQPAELEYNWSSFTECPIASYSRFIGMDDCSWADTPSLVKMHEYNGDDSVGYKLMERPQTYGALSQRLHAIA